MSAPSPDDTPGGEPLLPPLRDLPPVRADCTACVGLCCVALPTTASADFARTKPAGVPCRHLRGDDRCEIHDRLRERGWRGCVVFECFGAGQRATARFRAEVEGGRKELEPSWRDLDDVTRQRVFAAFGSLRRLHETAYHLSMTLTVVGGALPRERRHQLLERLREVVVWSDRPLGRLASHDPTALQRAAGTELSAVSVELRASRRAAGHWPGRMARGVGPDADLAGRRLAGRDLRTADLRGALLVGADLRDADLRWSDLLGADLRDADLRGADLRGALFVSPPQLEAALGDAATRPPDGLLVPSHWL